MSSGPKVIIPCQPHWYAMILGEDGDSAWAVPIGAWGHYEDGTVCAMIPANDANGSYDAVLVPVDSERSLGIAYGTDASNPNWQDIARSRNWQDAIGQVDSSDENAKVVYKHLTEARDLTARDIVQTIEGIQTERRGFWFNHDDVHALYEQDVFCDSENGRWYHVTKLGEKVLDLAKADVTKEDLLRETGENPPTTAEAVAAAAVDLVTEEAQRRLAEATLADPPTEEQLDALARGDKPTESNDDDVPDNVPF